MANIFTSLNTGISGLNAANLQINTTSNNIANADSQHYTRQRAVQSASASVYDVPGGIGTGTQIDTIVRIHDEFVFNRLKSSSSSLENTQYKQRIMQEIANNFPDLKEVGLGKDIKQYFDSWGNFASNPKEGSQKINLINNTVSLTLNLRNTAKNLNDLHYEADGVLRINIDEFNRMGEQIANINKQIQKVESGRDGGIRINANDLRDKRDELEMAMSKLMNVKSYKSDISSNTPVDSGITDQGRHYTLNVGGVNIIEGVNFHPLTLKPIGIGKNFAGIYYEREDGKLLSMHDKIYNGKIGAALDLRGRNYDENANKFTDGNIQKYIDSLNTFSQTLIRSTNNIYAQSSVEISNTESFDHLESSKTLTNFSRDIQNGNFEVIVYDKSGKEVAKKTININATTTMDDTRFGNSIVSDFNSNSDDNNDKNNLNDVDDYFTASYHYDANSGNGVFSLSPKQTQGDYTIAFKDNGTNFPGIIGVNKFFNGKNASDIEINNDFIKDHTKLKAYAKPTQGNNEVANAMVQLQYNSLNFYTKGISPDKKETIEGYYRFLTTDLASDTEANNNLHDTNTALFNSVQGEYQSISGVDTNEELTNLIRFQASYGAAAKIITTVDQMLDTLLSLKQ